MADDGLEFSIKLDADVSGARDLKSVLAGLDSTLKGIDAKLGKVEGGSHAAAEGHKKHAHSAGILGQALHHLSSASIDPLLHKLKEVAEFEFMRRAIDKVIELPGELIEKVKELASELIHAAAEAEKTQMSFELLFGVEQGHELLENIEQIGKSSAVSENQLEQMTLELGRVGLTGNNLLRARAAAEDIAAFGGSADAAAGALTRVQLTGQVSNRTLRPLGIQEKDFLGALAARTGLGLKEVKKKLDAGKIDAHESLEALYTVLAGKTGKDLGGAGVAFSKTLDARLMRLHQIPEQLGKALRKSEGFTAISDFVGNLADSLSPGTPAFAKLEGGLEEITNAIAKELGAVNTGDLVDKIVYGMHEVSLAIGPVVRMMKELLRITVQTAEGFGLMAGAIGMVGTSRGRKAVAAQADKAIYGGTDLPKADRLKNAFRSLGSIITFGAIDGPTLAAKKAGEAMFNKGKDAGLGYTMGMQSVMPSATVTGADLGMSSAEGLGEATETHSPSRLFARLGKMSVAGYVDGIEEASGNIDAAVRGMATARPGPMGAGGGRGNATITVGDIVVHVGGDISQHGAEHIAEEAKEAIRQAGVAALQGAFEQWASQTGAT